ncbi:MAG: T9SS type A sorting domain-containing protein [Chitinophagaceae bacterium]
MKTFKLLCLLIALSLPSFAQQVAKSISYPASPDGVIGFLEFKPSDYGTQKHPLIIFLHGWGERGNGTTQINAVTANGIPRLIAAGASMRFTVNGQTSSFVVLSPQLSAQYGTWDPFYVREMVKYAKANLQIDTNRIYVTGLSLGGGGVWRAITETPGGDYSFDGMIAAAAPVCGTQEETDANMCSTIAANHLPVWAFHSMDDGTVGVGATQHAEILLSWCSGMTPAAKFTYYQSGGHNGAWDNAYDTGHITTPVVVNGNVTSFTANPNLYEWFLSKTRSTGYTAPVASAGTAQTITLPTSTVTLSGSGTGTNGASISSYSWVKTSGPSSGSITTSNAASTTVTGLSQGVYVFSLTVTDNHGLTAVSSVTITVIAAPVADAGPSQTITTSSTALSASASYSTNGAITSYQWQQVSGPSAVVISNANSATPLVSDMSSGSSYSFQLTVTDVAGASSSAVTGVTVVSSLLPVQFSYFNGIAASGSNLLKWGTASEQNNSYFSIERSADGNSFTSIGSVTAIGNSSTAHDYSFTDGNLTAATYYYRLKQVDINGTFTYSKVIVVKSTVVVGSSVQLFPNPVISGLSIVLNNDTKGNGVITVYDINGRSLRQQAIAKTDQTASAVISMNDLSAGMYVVEIKIGDGYKLTKTVLKK